MDEFLNTIREFPFVGDATIAITVVILILTGRLVPRRALEDVIKERDAWHEAFEAQREVAQSVRDQNEKLLEVNRVTDHILTSFKERSDRA